MASAVIDKLLETGAFFGITTHHQHVKEKDFKHPDISAYATAFDLQALRSEYTLQEDTIGSSYALKIAERVGLDREIIEKAAVFLRENKNEKDQIIANITKFNNKLHNKESELKKREELLRQKKNNSLTNKNSNSKQKGWKLLTTN
ncbi:MutS domain V [Brevinema andersonii]|uniref:MutS domain V n=1 Tax=Brevinema andersonii TaxID=34097 RepID=A0A1I1EX58_BREAD|nr:MutS domain V [Brevinema andersonii]